VLLGIEKSRRVVITPAELEEAKYNCLMMGTPVVLADGSTMLIERIVRQRLPVEVLSQDENGRICARRVVGWHQKRVAGQPWTCIHTSAMHGKHRGLVLTPEHVVFTPTGNVSAALLKPGMRICFPEVAFSTLQSQAIFGTLLGDTRLVVSPVFRDRMLDAPNFSLDGGHIEEHGLAQYKVQFLAPHACFGRLHPRRITEFQNKPCVAKPFQTWRTPNLHQLARLAPLLYSKTGERLLPACFDELGAIGLAWWYMDDGCRQNMIGKPDHVTLALCRYRRHETEAARKWFEARYGRISMGEDQILRFSRGATVAFCEEIAPYVIPTMRYKLPHGERWPAFCNPKSENCGESTWTEVVSVEPYTPKTGTASDNLKAETRFCITVEDTHRFFTSFGLVRNCRDVLSMCRVFPHLVSAIEKFDVVDVYNTDEQLADLALQMTRIGLPVNSERRQEIGARLCKIRDDAIETLRPFTEGQYRAEFLSWIAKFFAVKARKGEPVAGSVRVGPTRAQAEVDEIQAVRKEWRAYRKESAADPAAVAEADKQLADLDIKLKEAKLVLKAARVEDDALDGAIHTNETAFEQRMKIRRADAELAIAKAGVKWTAKVQQAAILRAAGVPLTRTTGKSGLPKIDKEVLADFKRHPSAQALLKFILVSSTINVYIEGEKRAGGGGKSKPVMVTETGYINPLWGIHRITGRWNSSPNVQNWSKHAGGGAENLRSMIEAPEGYTFVGADQAQLEARLVGAMSECKYLCDTFRKGEDIHGAFAYVGFPEVWPTLAATFKEHKKAQRPGEKCRCVDCAERDRIRDLVKRMEYGAMYGGKEQAIWESLVGEFQTLTLRQVQLFLVNFARQCPEVLTWRTETLREAIDEGEIRSPILGRRQVFPLHRVEPTVAFNYKAQSGGADLWALGALEFMKRWDQFTSVDARLIHNGHDSVLILCRTELAKKVEADVYSCWNREWNGVPFFVEGRISNVWSET
jgi:hypothetical protein